MPIKVITPPEVEPVSLDELKASLPGGLADYSDETLARFIKIARQRLEEYLNRALAPRTIALYLDRLPCGDLQLPRPPLVEIDSFLYTGTDGIQYALVEDDDFAVDLISEPGWLAPVSSWPATLTTINAVRVQYQAGWAAEDVPEPIKQGLILWAAGLAKEGATSASSGDVRSLQVEGVGTVTYAASSASTSSASSTSLPNAVRWLIDPWRVPSI